MTPAVLFNGIFGGYAMILFFSAAAGLRSGWRSVASAPAAPGRGPAPAGPGRGAPISPGGTGGSGPAAPPAGASARGSRPAAAAPPAAAGRARGGVYGLIPWHMYRMTARRAAALATRRHARAARRAAAAPGPSPAPAPAGPAPAGPPTVPGPTPATTGPTPTTPVPSSPAPAAPAAAAAPAVADASAPAGLPPIPTPPPTHTPGPTVDPAPGIAPAPAAPARPGPVPPFTATPPAAASAPLPGAASTGARRHLSLVREPKEFPPMSDVEITDFQSTVAFSDSVSSLAGIEAEDAAAGAVITVAAAESADHTRQRVAEEVTGLEAGLAVMAALGVDQETLDAFTLVLETGAAYSEAAAEVSSDMADLSAKVSAMAAMATAYHEAAVAAGDTVQAHHADFADLVGSLGHASADEEWYDVAPADSRPAVPRPTTPALT